MVEGSVEREAGRGKGERCTFLDERQAPRGTSECYNVWDWSSQ